MTLIDPIIQRYPVPERRFLLSILQDIQKECGYISEADIVKIANHLGIPTSKVFAVATFYDQFRFLQAAPFRIRICNGTNCHLENSLRIIETFESQLGIKAGGTTRDRKISFETASCMGACGQGPVMRINDDFYNEMTAEKAIKIISNLKGKIEQA